MDFREKRLVFQDAPGDVPGAAASGENPKNHYDTATNTYYDANGNPSSVDPQAAVDFGYLSSSDEPYATEGPAAEQAAPAAEEAVVVEAKAERARLDAAISLSDLKQAMGDKFNKVADILKSKTLTGVITEDQLIDGFFFLGGEEAFQEAVSGQLSDAEIGTLRAALEQFYNLEGVDFREFLPKVAAVATMGIFKSTIEAKYPHILTFDKFKDGHIVIKYDLSFNGENPVLNLSLPSGVQELYDQHAASEQKKVEEAGQQQQAAATEQAEQQRLATDKEAFKDQLRKHPIGAFLVDFFDGPGSDGKPGMIDKLFEGKSPILAFLLGALGVGKFKGSYDNMRRMADKNPKLKGLFDQVEERVKPYRVDEPEAPAAAAVATEAPKFPQMNIKEFVGILDGRPVSDGGVQLSEQYAVPTDKTLKVDLRAGSLILPAGTSLNIKDKASESAIGNDREFNNIELVLVGAIPKGTIFHKGVKLELVSV